MIIPPYLKPGDTIALTATARSITAEQIDQAVRELEQAGFRVLIDEADPFEAQRTSDALPELHQMKSDV